MDISAQVLSLFSLPYGNFFKKLPALREPNLFLESYLMNYFGTFCPILTYLVSFTIYGLAIRDFDDGQISGGFMTFYIPCLITNLIVLPTVAMAQLAFGIYQMVKNNRKDGKLYIFSSLFV
ncbi:MAG: hypothetical protein AAFY98_05950, partial [Verrucomicrobiota bacterium]